MDNRDSYPWWAQIDENGRPEAELNSSPENAQNYAQARRLHEQLRQMEPETPSLRFQVNVMEQLPVMYRKVVARPLLYPRQVRGLAALLGSVLLANILLVLFAAPELTGNWQALATWAEQVSAATAGPAGRIAGALGFGVFCILLLDSLLAKRFSRNGNSSIER